MATNLPDDPQDFLRLVLKHLGTFKEDIGQYSTRESLFSQKVAAEISQIKSILAQTISHLQEDFENLNGGADPIEFLLALGQLRQSFEGVQVTIFRNSVLSIQPTPATQYDIIATQQYPVYLSQFPALPAGTNTCQIRISINAQEHFDRIVPLTTIASDFISTTVKELSLPYAPDLTVCKAIGLNEYVYGEKALSNFQCIREAVRKRKALHVSLIRRQSLDFNVVDRILALGKQMQKEFLERAGRLHDVEDLVIEDADDDGEFDFDAIQNQRLQQQQNKDLGALPPGTSLLQHFDDSSDDELGFSRTADYKGTKSRLGGHGAEHSITSSVSLQYRSSPSPHTTTLDQFKTTPSKRKQSILAGRDRTPSPEPATRPNNQQTGPSYKSPQLDDDDVKIVPLSLALQQRSTIDPANFHIDDDYNTNKRQSSLIDVPEIFKRSPGVQARLSALDANLYGLDNISDTDNESPHPNPGSFFTHARIPSIEVLTPRGASGATAGTAAATASANRPFSGSRTRSRSNSFSKSVVTDEPQPSPKAADAAAQSPTASELEIGAYGFKDEILQRKLVQERVINHQRRNSKQMELNDSDEEEFCQQKSPSGTRNSPKHASNEQNNTSTTLPVPSDPTTLPVPPPSELPKTNSTSLVTAAEMRRTSSSYIDSQSQTDAALAASPSIPADEAEGMFLGAARSPHKRMAARTSSQASLLPTQSDHKGAESSTPQPEPVATIATSPTPEPEGESMFGGASSRPNRRMAAPRGQQQQQQQQQQQPKSQPLPPPPALPSIQTNTNSNYTPSWDSYSFNSCFLDEDEGTDYFSQLQRGVSASPLPPPPPLPETLPDENDQSDNQANNQAQPSNLDESDTDPLPEPPAPPDQPQSTQPPPPSLNLKLSSPPSSQTSNIDSPRNILVPAGFGGSIPPPPPKTKKANSVNSQHSQSENSYTDPLTPLDAPLVAPTSQPQLPPMISISSILSQPAERPAQNIKTPSASVHDEGDDHFPSQRRSVSGKRSVSSKGEHSKEEEGDFIAPLSAEFAPVTRQTSRSISSTTTPEQLLAQAASQTVTKASPNFFMAANKPAAAPSSSASSMAATGNRRASVQFGAMSSTASKGSLFRFQNSTLGPENIAEMQSAVDTGMQSRGKLAIPQLSQQKIDHYRQAIDYEDDTPLTVDFKQATLSSQETHLPYMRLNVVGVDGVNFASCPRLAQYQGFSKLYLACCLVHGETIRAESVASTREIDPSSAPRWNETILPTARPITYGSILRESKIAFILVARFTNKIEKSPDTSFDANKDVRDVPIAWVSEQMFLETNQLLSGRHHFELWPLGNGDPDDHTDITSALGASQVLIETTHEKRTIPATVIDRKRDKKDKKDKKDKDKQRLQLEMGKMNPFVVRGVDLQLQQYIFRGVNCPNFLTQEPAVLTVDFDAFSAPIVTPLESQATYSPSQYQENGIKALSTLSRDDDFRVSVLSTEDALYTLTDEDKQLIWTAREKVRTIPHMIVKFVQSVNWSDSEQRYEAQSLLRRWAELTHPAQIIAILDQPVQDYEVRRYAVDRLKKFSLGHIQQYLLQLTQCLKYEPYHNSPLSRYLLQLAIQYPSQIGTYYYWNLKNELCCDPPFTLRFAALLEAFLTFCPQATEQLRAQQQIIDECKRIALTIQRKKATSTDLELETLYRDAITSFNRDFLQRVPKFQLPLDSRWEATGLIPEKCKIMSSKMAPLWLVFQNADPSGDSLYLIFKAGDDLRQDMLTLQILRFMDETWLENGLDLRLSPYNVVACGMTEDGRGCGMIEVVLNSQTTAGIQRSYGGGASGAFQEDTIWRFLLEHNKTPETITRATDNFLRSCAGYCVATYILGIGDRHNGNIMVTKDGHLFHIDFGHFLGNFKSKMGINRERAAFVCTPEMIYAACGGSNDQSSQQFEQFSKLCQDAFVFIRQHASELEILFISMVGAGMPECLSKQAILYIRQKLSLEQTEIQARATFKAELLKAVNSTSRKIDNFIHLVKHSSKA